jgi:hypothetical protein
MNASLEAQHVAPHNQVEVARRARTRGKSKYGLAVFLWRPLLDMLGLLWLFRRRLSQHTTLRP